MSGGIGVLSKIGLRLEVSRGVERVHEPMIWGSVAVTRISAVRVR